MSASEFSRIYRVRPLPAEPIALEANETERAALAKRFGLEKISSLNAKISLEDNGKAIIAKGAMDANIIQNCAVTLEGLPVTLHERIDLRFVPPQQYDAEPDIELEISAEELDEIEFTGDEFDLGEAVAQTLGLAIDPYLEGPNAERTRELHDLTEGKRANPFAALKKLQDNNQPLD